MILVDSSVWIDHFKHANAELSALLEARLVMSHPFVIGELACGQLTKRDAVLATVATLPSTPLLPNQEVLGFVERHALMGMGIGWVDVHLLASTILAGGVSLWSRDKRLAAAATLRGVAYVPAVS